MSVLDFFKGKQYKEERDTIQQKLQDLESKLTPEIWDNIKLQESTSQLKKEYEELQKQIEAAKNEYLHGKKYLEEQIKEKKALIVQLDDEILVQEFGLYTPRYEIATALGYKEVLQSIRTKQKEMIKSKTAVTGSTNWTVDGNASKGKKMVSDTQKLLLRAFNSECDEIISKVKYSNYDASKKKIEKSVETISKLGTIMSISITPAYKDLKLQELCLVFEYQMKKQEEKEEQREIREQMREAAKLQKEIEAQRKKIEKEQFHYQTAYTKICEQLENDSSNQEYIKKKEELEAHLSEIDKSLRDIDYREANQRAGYVYIISNIGSFGENVYKIGMTRRLDPQDRVDELGDASVPFKFDVHAMIFSDDAPALEAELHRAFSDRKLNMVNQRREFFNVSLDEIKDVVQKNFDKTVEFIDVPDAEQYRISLKMKEASQNDII
ncbi:MAG: DUF4041 domain-containing protein [Lachnospiraceae bacterium]|nr:DUF4041 domain-containing protein [Lachnospiraceae bacterium]